MINILITLLYLKKTPLTIEYLLTILKIISALAQVSELVDERDSKSRGRKAMRVRLPLWAHYSKQKASTQC
jgi:chromosome segregation and condensation protein ScpB